MDRLARARAALPWARRSEHLAEGAARLASTLEVTRRAATSRTREAALSTVASHFGERTGALLCELAIRDEDGQFVPAAVWGGRTDRERDPQAEQRFVSRVVTGDRPVLERLPRGEGHPFRVVLDRADVHAAYIAGVPLHVHDEVVGALCAAYAEPLPMPAARLLDEGIAHAAVAGLCLHAAREVQTWRRLATHDSLTGCLNRVALWDVLEEETERCERHGRALSCAMLDLDRFKEINDRWGHAAGDEVLVEVGVAIQRSVRLYDHVARYGGDEFVVVMPETGLEAAREVVERVAEAIRRATADIGHPVGISAGIAGWARGVSPAGLLAVADRLMFDAKRSGRLLAAAQAPPDERVEEARPARARAPRGAR